jgi:hypothetical protein
LQQEERLYWQSQRNHLRCLSMNLAASRRNGTLRKWVLPAGVIVLAVAAVVLIRHNRNSRRKAVLTENIPAFVAVRDQRPAGVKDLRGMQRVWHRLQADLWVARQGRKYTWTFSLRAPVGRVLEGYRSWVDRPVFVGRDVESTVLDNFQLSARTHPGMLNCFEQMLSTNQIVFVRDRTNAVWVMHATNELAFRRKFGLKHWWDLF